MNREHRNKPTSHYVTVFYLIAAAIYLLAKVKLASICNEHTEYDQIMLELLHTFKYLLLHLKRSSNHPKQSPLNSKQVKVNLMLYHPRHCLTTACPAETFPQDFSYLIQSYLKK